MAVDPDVLTITGRLEARLVALEAASIHGVTGDGITDDSAALQTAYNNMPSGGELIIPPGDYRLSIGLVYASGGPVGDRTVKVSAYGARLLPDPGVVALTLTTSNNPRMGGTVRGLKVSGGGVGVRFHNCGYWRVEDFNIEKADIGVQYLSDETMSDFPRQPTFSEANYLEHGLIDSCTAHGIKFEKTEGGNGSFAENRISGVVSRHSPVAFEVGEDARVHRCWFYGVTCFIKSGQTGFQFDGMLDEMHLIGAVECVKNPPVESFGVRVGPTAIHSEHQDTSMSFTGVGRNFNRVDLAPGKSFPYREGRRRAGDSLFAGEFWDEASGPTLRSPNATEHRIKVADDGALSTEAV